MPDFGRWTSNGGDPSLNEINRVDRYFDALASKDTAYSTDNAEAELAFLLSDWRDEVREAPVTVPVSMRDAEAALHGARSGRKRNRTSFALVGSVAAAALCIGGFSTALYGAEPGDALYGFRTTLFGQEQVRDDRVALASAELQQVQQLIDQGQWEQAQDKLVALSTTVQDVDAPEQKQELVEQWNALTYKVVEQDPAATLPPPGEPLPELPNSPLTLMPVPVFDAPVTSTSTDTSTTTTTPTTPTTTGTSSEPPGPEILMTPPTSPSEPTSPGQPPPPSTTTTTPPSTTTTTPPSPTTTTTTTTTVTQIPAATATSVPRSAAPPPPVALPPPASEPPPRQPQLAPTSPAASPSSPAVAPSPPESSTTVPQEPSEEEEGEEQEVVTTTVAPPS